MNVPVPRRRSQFSRFTAAIAPFLLWIIPAGNLHAQFAASQVRLVPSPESSADGERPCVLLKNDNVLFGQAQQFGEFVVVRTGPNDELKLPRSDVACWAKSLANLYQYRLDHRPAKDLASHLIDAKWCIQYELLDLAAQELQAAKAISPNHPEVRLLEGQLQRLSQPVPRPIATITTTTFLQAAFPAGDGEANRIDPWILKGFSSHVQSTLINRCGRCHSQRSERDWQLLVPSPGTRVTARMTRENLTKAIQFIDRNDPERSPLLIKATSPHGGDSVAPLNARNATAIRAFRHWLGQTAESVDHGPRVGESEPDQTESKRNAFSEPESIEPESAVAPVSFESEVAATPIPTGNPNPKRLPTVANPFDPSLFNRRFHGRDK